jgi:type I restriction enzyme S subunit
MTTRRFNRYPAYKDSGVEWLGEIPAHWDAARLKELVSGIEQGWSPLCENRQADEGEWGVMKVGCVNGEDFDEGEHKALPAELQPVPEYEIRPGDILMSRANTRELLGSAVLVRSVRARLLLCDKLYRIRVSHGRVLPEFVVRAVASRVTRFQLEREATGASASMQNISQETISNLLFPLPSAGEQRAIAAFLDRETARIDALVAKKERLIALLQEQRTALITRAVTKGLDPTVPMKDSGVEWLGEIPAHWEVKPLKALSQLQTGLTLGKKYEEKKLVVRPYLRVANVQDGYLDLDDIAEVEIPLQDALRYELRDGDVLVTEGGDFDKLGRGHVWAGQIAPCLHQNHLRGSTANPSSQCTVPRSRNEQRLWTGLLHCNRETVYEPSVD